MSFSDALNQFVKVICWLTFDCWRRRDCIPEIVYVVVMKTREHNSAPVYINKVGFLLCQAAREPSGGDPGGRGDVDIHRAAGHCSPG